MQLVPAGVIGELYVGGDGLSIGYVMLPEQTAESFVPHPHVRTGGGGVGKGVIGDPYGAYPQAGSRLYRTGDLARYNEDGQIEFLGRRDDQVKLRGYRIELEEIEAVLRRHPLVWNCVVILQEQGPGAPMLVGYIVGRTASELTVQSLRE